jgi:hypothetical protein
MMLWASKYDDDQVIECALNKVDLHHMEQNDAPRIVQFVAENDIETALQRMESFGGNDKEGIQRKFILYMLCLMELTLLESKAQPWRKSAIEKLLKHLDDNLPIDHSVLNWIDFYPDYLMFQVSYEFLKIGVDYNAIFVRTSHWEGEWIESYGPYTKEAWPILEIILKSISDEEKHFQYAKYLLGHYIQKNGIRLMKSFLQGVLEEEAKQDLLEFAISELGKLGKLKTALSFIPSSSDGNEREKLLSGLALVTLKSGNYPKALEILLLIRHRYYKVKTHCAIGEFFFAAKDGRYLEHIHSALSIAKLIRNVSWSLMAARTIALTFINIKRYKKAYVMLKETMLLEPNSDYVRFFLVEKLAQKLASKRKLENAIEIANCIANISDRNKALSLIAEESVKCGKLKYAQQILKLVNLEQEDYPGLYRWDVVLSRASKSLVNSGRNRKAFQIGRLIADDSEKIRVYCHIANSQFRSNNTEFAYQVIKESIAISLKIDNSYDRYEGLKDIISLLLKYNLIDDAKKLLKYIKDDYWSFISNVNGKFSLYFLNAGQVEKAWTYANSIENLEYRFSFIKSFLNHSYFCRNLNDLKQIIIGWIEYQDKLNYKEYTDEQLSSISSSLILKGNYDSALICAQSIDKAEKKIVSLISVSSAYYRNQLEKSNIIFQQAINLSKIINNEWERCQALKDLAVEGKKQGFTNESYLLLMEALGVIPSMDYPWNFMALARLYSDFFEIGKMDVILNVANQLIESEFDNCGTYVEISIAWVKHGNLALGLTCARGIDTVLERVEAISQISTVLASISDSKNSADLMQEALQIARSIDDFYERHRALMSVCFELNKQGQLQEFTEILKEAHETALDIDDDSDRSTSLKNIAIQFAGLGDVSQSLEILSGGIDSIDRTDALIDISVEQSKQGNWKSAEFISLQILQVAKRWACWRKLAKSTLDEKGLNEAMQQFRGIEESEMKMYFLKGLAHSMFAVSCDKNFVLNIRQYFRDDIDSLLKLLHKHSLHELFFQDPEISKIERFNRTLRIQWAIDIINKN